MQKNSDFMDIEEKAFPPEALAELTGEGQYIR
jgi:hypothetical protein